jgi:hypothetical protein
LTPTSSWDGFLRLSIGEPTMEEDLFYVENDRSYGR